MICALCVRIHTSSCVFQVGHGLSLSTCVGEPDTVIHREDLTSADVYGYASDHLENTLSAEDADVLVSCKAYKSQGVFFLLFLPMRLLKERIEGLSAMKLLLRRLEGSPSGLEDLPTLI